MKYELASIIKDFYDNGKVFFYGYTYGTKSCIGFAPISQRQALIDFGIIQEADVIENYDIQSVIDDLYDNASR